MRDQRRKFLGDVDRLHSKGLHGSCAASECPFGNARNNWLTGVRKAAERDGERQLASRDALAPTLRARYGEALANAWLALPPDELLRAVLTHEQNATARRVEAARELAALNDLRLATTD